MPNTPFAKIPYPSGSDAPAAAADMMAAFMTMDSRLVLPAIDEADRDAKYYDAPVSTLVVSGDSQKIWLKRGPNPSDWLTIWEDTGWVTQGFVVQSGWSNDNMSARRFGRNINIRGQLTRTGGAISFPGNGNIADMDLVSVPPQFRPESTAPPVPGIARYTRTTGGAELYSHGLIRAMDGHANADVTTGEYVRFNFSYLAV